MRLNKITLATLSIITGFTLVGCEKTDDTNGSQAAGTQTTKSMPATAVSAAEQSAETAKLNAWFEDKFEQELMLSPTSLTVLGRSQRQDEIDDYSEQAYDAQIALKKANLKELQSTFDYAKLTDDAKISYDLWIYLSDQAIAAYEFRYNRYVFEQMNAVHSFFPQLLIALHKVETGEHMQQYLKRISASGTALDQLILVSKKIAEKGVRPPYFAFEAVIDESTKIISGAPFSDGVDSAIWADAQTKIKGLLEQNQLTQSEADDLTNNIKKALIEDFKPAYERLIAWQRADRVNASEEALGANALPNGLAFYNERLANQTTTDLSADEVHNIGLKEVARLRAEMEVVKAEFGFEGSLQEFFVFLRDTKDDERLYYPDTDAGRQAYIDDATAAINKIKKVLPDYFGILPKADMVVKRVEAFREQDGAAQHYSSSTPDGSRPGVYYAHLSDMTAMPKRELEVIAYHEGLPGHHMQIAISLELDGVPTFRKQSYLNAYGEGWALYSEWLAKQMPGTYQDPLSEFGRLGSEMWRAIRLVVDTGLHAKGWSEEEAITYFKENSAITGEQAQSEVRRYLTLPGQATGYKIGMLKIQELRALAEKQLGDKFDIKAFHDVILGGGALPMVILERKVKAWITSQK
ncbi:DUF885 domain-containing protein [Brumicola nitratireducens]|uniref:Lipoprotein n=1 Tax=Glaciecola nitratireducens (strain JCM 12485 / KCTC 12276 / FR1064) TaxID=1085623 RepID=G4QE31_GLANF|nr:DUF885 domain-containing protein [Glaciecola nitratireducens]AEP31305.1 hypothetical protein GNIT_3211 [Glaciecola nitratireducens FR1064]